MDRRKKVLCGVSKFVRPREMACRGKTDGDAEGESRGPSGVGAAGCRGEGSEGPTGKMAGESGGKGMRDGRSG